QSGGGRVTLRRADLAQRFGCAPSQISYVLETRFGLERGYRVESRRGGGGYVRIERVEVEGCDEWLSRLERLIGEYISEDRARGVVDWLQRESWLDDRSAAIMRAALGREALGLPLPLRDQVRARLLKAMAQALLPYGRASAEGKL
ncbi:MAG: CtsR family transcriptional regulator, partial [Firmicutes bacterium]|nr:CtsR family transcriptional regulator [Bacillota bacterium]